MIKRLNNMFHVKHIADYIINYRATRLTLAVLFVAALALGCTQVSKPSGWASPVPINDMLLISNKDGSVSAIRPPTGGGQASVVWTFPTDKKQKQKFTAIYATPIVADVSGEKRVFVSAYSGDVVAINAGNGQVANGWPTAVNVGGHIAATPAF